MSILILLSLGAADPAGAEVERLLADYRRATTVAIRCSGGEVAPGEVLVCGRRRADGYRLPLTGGTGGTRRDPTPAQREALLVPASKCEEKSLFLVGCGSVGVGVGISSDGKSRLLRPRELSP